MTAMAIGLRSINYDESLGTSSLIREYARANGVVVGLYEAALSALCAQFIARQTRLAAVLVLRSVPFI
jgi:hypothetical protein